MFPISTGGNARPQDARDLKLGSLQVPASIPRTLGRDFSAIPADFQSHLPACGAHAAAFFDAAKQMLKYGAPFHFSPRFNWIEIKQNFDTTPPESGTNLLAIMKSLQKRGACDFSLLGNDTSLDLAAYGNPDVITPTELGNALPRSIDSYAFVDRPDISFDSLRQAIAQNDLVIALLDIGVEFYTSSKGTISWQAADILPLRAPKQRLSGHFVVLYDYDDNYLYFRNSWGPGWGKNGNGWFGRDYVPYVAEIGTAVFLPFTKELGVGMTDPDVVRLQRRLNQHPKTIVAPSGPGAPGNETAYYGGLTKLAVAKFQTLNGIVPTGYVGPRTLACLNGSAD